MLSLGINWMFTEFIYYLSKINLYVEGVPIDEIQVYNDEDDDDDSITEDRLTGTKKPRKNQNQEEEDYYNEPRPPKNVTVYYACDKMSTLYVLNQAMLKKTSSNRSGMRNCSR